MNVSPLFILLNSYFAISRWTIDNTSLLLPKMVLIINLLTTDTWWLGDIQANTLFAGLSDQPTLHGRKIQI